MNSKQPMTGAAGSFKAWVTGTLGVASPIAERTGTFDHSRWQVGGTGSCVNKLEVGRLTAGPLAGRIRPDPTRSSKGEENKTQHATACNIGIRSCCSIATLCKTAQASTISHALSGVTLRCCRQLNLDFTCPNVISIRALVPCLGIMY